MIVHVGMKAYVPKEQIVALIDLDSEPVRRLVAQARQQGRVLDATKGRRARTAVRLLNQDIILSALTSEAIAARMNGGQATTSLHPDGKPRAKPVKVCIGCGRIFEARHGNMRYCPECARKVEAQRKGDPERARFRAALHRAGLSQAAPEGSAEREKLSQAYRDGGMQAMLREANRLRIGVGDGAAQ